MRILRDVQSFDPKKVFVGLFVFGLSLRIYGVVKAVTIAVDGTQYAIIAQEFLQGRVTEALSNVFSPGYPVFISLFALFINNIELAGRVASLAMGTVTIIGVYVFTKKFFSERLALLHVLLVGIHPYLVRSSAEVLSEATCYALFTFTMLCFVWAYEESSKGNIFLCGLLTGSTYLTRPEFIVYFAPMVGWLLYKRKIALIALLFCALGCLALPYVVYISLKAGLPLISMKQYAIGLPINLSDLSGSIFETSLKTLRNVPFVTYYFFEAVFVTLVPFFLIGIFKGAIRNRTVELILASIVVTHIISIASITSSHARYSVTLVPLVLVWAAMGLEKTLDWVSVRFIGRRRLVAVCLIFVVIGGSALPKALRPIRSHRAINKEAGIWLKEHVSGSVVMSRIPQEAFYSDSRYIPITPKDVFKIDYEQLIKRAREQKVDYVIEDYKMKEICPDFEKQVSKNDLEEIMVIKKGKEFIRIYKLN